MKLLWRGMLTLGACGDTQDRVPRYSTFLIGNVGGGLKWCARNNRWGLRGDYRFVANRSKDDAPAFFGGDRRYIHRVYAGLIINTIR